MLTPKPQNPDNVLRFITRARQNLLSELWQAKSFESSFILLFVMNMVVKGSPAEAATHAPASTIAAKATTTEAAAITGTSPAAVSAPSSATGVASTARAVARAIIPCVDTTHGIGGNEAVKLFESHFLHGEAVLDGQGVQHHESGLHARINSLHYYNV